jgi:hypothetical protein
MKTPSGQIGPVYARARGRGAFRQIDVQRSMVGLTGAYLSVCALVIFRGEQTAQRVRLSDGAPQFLHSREGGRLLLMKIIFPLVVQAWRHGESPWHPAKRVPI